MFEKLKSVFLQKPPWVRPLEHSKARTRTTSIQPMRTYVRIAVAKQNMRTFGIGIQLPERQPFYFHQFRIDTEYKLKSYEHPNATHDLCSLFCYETANF